MEHQTEVHSPIVFGLWPLAGITTVGVTQDDAERTLAAAIEVGIEQFDTAFSYGYQGECDKLLGLAIGRQRDRFRVISKVGQRWDASLNRTIDGSPRTLVSDAETSLRRIGIDDFDCLMLHCPDTNVPIERSAEALASLKRRGLCREIGVCNVSVSQWRSFVAAAGPAAVQCPLNLMQRDTLDDLIPAAAADRCDVYVFWTLMKGLLAGRIGREHQFAVGDVRPNYDIFRGESRRRTHDVLDQMQQIADESQTTIAQLAIGWALAQPGVTSALVGARRPEQIRETALARPLSASTAARIEALLDRAEGRDRAERRDRAE